MGHAMPSASRISREMPSVFLNASAAPRRDKNALRRAHRLRAALVSITNHFYSPPGRFATVRRSSKYLYSVARPTMQAATLVALLIPVVAIWITVVVRYGRSIEEVVAVAIEKEE